MIVYCSSEKKYKNVLESKLAKKIFFIPASYAAVGRAFSSAAVIVSRRRSNISLSTVNDIILVRLTATHLKGYL
jgi:hypothetical protein